MDIYYRKSMGNGTVASKFRLNVLSTIQSNQPNLKEQTVADNTSAEISRTDKTVLSGVKADDNTTNGNGGKYPIEFPETHHPNNCIRCYRLKKKCSRAYPKCSTCLKARSACEYIERSNKRRKRTSAAKNTKQDEENSVLESSEKESQVFDIVDEQGNPESDESSSDKQVVAHKLVSISSLLSNEMTEEQQSKDPSKRIPIPKQRKTTPRRESVTSSKSIIESLPFKVLNSKCKNNLKEEFITMKSFENHELPSTFITNYFHNYENKYPFINKVTFLETFKKIDFKTETIINLDIYLLMSIGCLIYDSNKQTKLFNSYFSGKSIESIIEILNLNININIEDDIENIKLLLLLTIYSLNSSNEDLCWGLLGILNRLVVQFDLFKETSIINSIIKERIFWSIYNLDKELSLLLDKPSQLPANEFISLEFPLSKKFYEDEDINLINQGIQLSKLQDSLSYLKLKNESARATKDLNLKDFSNNLEKWRVSTTSVIHHSLAQSPYLQDFTSLVNLNYYYLLIELDQISASESFQFTLHFLSNSFALLIIDNSKTDVELTLNSLFWYKKFFKVVKYNLKSWFKIMNSSTINKLDISLKLSEFNGNLQLTINLLKFLAQYHLKPDSLLSKINLCIQYLNALNLKLISFNIMTSSDNDKLTLSDDVSNIKSNLEVII